MDNGIHFITGLPRSGSTLLAGILRQNPRFHAGVSSPVATMLNHLVSAMGAHHAYSVFIDDEQRHDIVHSLFEAYYRKIHPHKLVFDTSRVWCSRIPALSRLFPEAKVIACVRDPVRVIDSFERLYRNAPFLASKMFNAETSVTVYTRVDALTAKSGAVGFCLHALHEAFYGEHASRLILVDYEALTREPKRTMERLYELLELPRFEHDFDNVIDEDPGDIETRSGMQGLHEITRQVRYVERSIILPPDIVSRFPKHGFWRRLDFNPQNVPVLLPSTSGSNHRSEFAPSGSTFARQPHLQVGGAPRAARIRPHGSALRSNPGGGDGQ